MKWSTSLLKLVPQLARQSGTHNPLRQTLFAVNSGVVSTGGFQPNRQVSLLTWDRLDTRPVERFARLPGVLDQCFLTYIWIDGTGTDLRAKTKSVEEEPKSIQELDGWHFDGSSTYQAVGTDSDMMLKPVAWCGDPVFPGKSKIVLCEVYDKDGLPAPTNHRAECAKICEKVEAHEPWFGMEQEYTLLGTDSRPLGFPHLGFPADQGPYYCSVGAGNAVGREINDAHFMACNYAGLTVTGTNAEVLLGQWEYQIGPCHGIDVADQLWMSRYILHRVAEEFGVKVTLDPKPIEGNWNGTGNHANFSTNRMREEGGISEIWKAIKKLEKKHMEHIAAYDPRGGEDNKRRLTGLHETAPIDKFSAGEGSRAVSIRIPRSVGLHKKGWMEDRRPSANADPYKVVGMLLKTTLVDA